ncbi:MAG: family 1 glycosylhydrolase, partial [Candidatus Methylomirabilis sp.]|nr:family 1 glycosylhydrolase [Deltaproteobacteria bacterium]
MRRWALSGPALRQRAGLAPETAKADPPTLLAVGLGDSMIPLIGVATAGYQIEGYRNAEDNKTDWAEFEDRLAAPQYVPNFQKAGLAANHYEKFEEDFALLETLGVKTFRMSIEWARIEPEPGVGDPAAIDHYRAVFESLRAHGVTPVVTLQHFTLPAWTTDLDGSGLTAWENPAIVDRFVAYAAFCAETFGGYVDWWSPINEPNVLGFFGYFTPLLTPGIGVGNVQDLEPAFRALRNMAFAHAGAYDAIKRFDTVSATPGGGPANVGVVVSMNLHEPAPSDDPVVQAQNDFAAGAWDYFFINGWLNAVTSGVLDYDLDQQLVPNEETGEGFQPFLANRTDFIGINYYGRQIVSADYCTLPDNTQIDCFSGSGGAFAGFPRVDPEGPYKTRLIRDETEVFAEGLRRRLTEAYQRYGLPVLVAENGMFTYNHEERTGFLLDHFGAVQRAVVEDGTPVLGYLYWTFLDTFEWFYGWQPGYALVNVTQGPLQTAPAPAAPETFVRRPGRAAYLLGELSRAGALSEALETKYRAPAPAATGFLWGSAVSAYQVEGGDARSDIHELCDVLLACKDPATQDAVVVGDAADHYNRYAEDFDLLGTSEAPGSLGLNAHRMAIDWARVETSPGVYDEAEIAHYSDVIDALRARGLEPVVTLHHLAFPKWALDPADASADQGFADAAVRERFVAFVGRMAEEFGDRVDWWITINEPFFSGVARYLPELFFPADASPQDEALARAVH